MYFTLKRFFICLSLSCFLCACAKSPNDAFASTSLSKPLAQKTNTSTSESSHSLFSFFSESQSLWTEMARHFDLNDESTDRPVVRQWIQWYAHHPRYLQRMATRSKPYLYYIYRQVRKRDLPAELTLLPMVESAYNPFAINAGSGAVGLWQMMPGTASGFGLQVDWWYDGRRDVIASTGAALDYLAYLGSFFDGNWFLAIAAYDAGEGTVHQAIEYNARHGKSTRFWDLNLSRETQSYVPKLLALAAIVQRDDHYGVKLPDVPNRPYLEEVNVGSQIDLVHAAQMAGISLSELTQLNPGYNRWATDPRGPFKLALPIQNVERFKKALAALPKQKRTTWLRVQVKKGDTLSGIAHRYHTSTRLIRDMNKMHSNVLHPGQTLLLARQSSSVTQLVLKHEKTFVKRLHVLPDPKVIHYKVKVKDTLQHIAHRFHVTIRQIKFWNKATTGRKVLAPGTDLVIWPPHVRYSYHTHVLTHKVKSGETLSGISHHYHVSIAKIKHENHMRNNSIRLGQTLYIPQVYKVIHHHITRTTRNLHNYRIKKGDTVSGIAHHFKESSYQLMYDNHIHNPKQIRPGKIIHVRK